MTQDEIIRSPLGREQLVALALETGALVFRSNFCDSSFDFNLEQIERFAALVVAHAKTEEREACAKVCDNIGDIDNGYGCAAAIRARGNV